MSQEGQFDDIKHYGIAFNGSKAHFYLARPQLSCENGQASWRGCALDQLATYNAKTSTHVLRIQQWINEIHNWGMGGYSFHFMLDVKGIFRSLPGGLERVSLLPQEARALGLPSD
jgi:hypothetical protein